MSLTPSEKSKLERTLEQQRIWYHKNREKVIQKKREWYQQNRAKIIAKNKEWKEKQRAEKERLKQEELKTIGTFKKKLCLYQILDVLRKDPRHYLWGTSVKNWTEKDWNNFNLLENITENRNTEENYQNT